MWETAENHQKLHEMGLDATVWAENWSESIPEALGSLWDASRPPKTTKKHQKCGISGFRGSAGYSCLFPLFAFKGCEQYF